MAVDDGDAASVLDFWFSDVPAEKRFAKDPALDRIIKTRFSALRDAVLASDATGWRETSDRLLAAVILLDQFSRNIHRGGDQAFAADPLARSLTLQALSEGWEARYTSEQLLFLYLPLAHAEDLEMQTLSVAKYEALGDPGALSAAQDHAEVMRRYGRFPSRNQPLGRPSTAAEILYLKTTDHKW